MPTVRPNGAVVETDLGDELILLDPATREMFSLNATGRTIWQALRAGGSLTEAVQRVADTFDVPAEVARADADALIERLTAAGLVVVAPEGPPGASDVPSAIEPGPAA